MLKSCFFFVRVECGGLCRAKIVPRSFNPRKVELFIATNTTKLVLGFFLNCANSSISREELEGLGVVGVRCVFFGDCRFLECPGARGLEGPGMLCA